MTRPAQITVQRNRVTLEVKRGSPRGFTIARRAPTTIIVERRAFGGGAQSAVDYLAHYILSSR